MNRNLVRNIILERLRDNKRVYLDRFILFLGSLILFTPFMFFFGSTFFGIWVILFLILDLAVIAKSSRIFLFKINGIPPLVVDSFPLTSLEKFSISFVFNLIDYSLIIAAVSAVANIFLFEVTSALELMAYIPLLFLQLVFLLSIPYAYKVIDIDLRRFESPLKSLLKKILVLVLFLIFIFSIIITLSSALVFLLNKETLVQITSFIDSPAFFIGIFLSIDIFFLRKYILNEMTFDEHESGKIVHGQLEMNILPLLKGVLIFLPLAVVTVYLSYLNSSNNYNSYLIYERLVGHENSINKLYKSENTKESIEKIRSRDYIEAKMNWFTDKMLVSWTVESDKLEILKGITASNREEMTSEICKRVLKDKSECGYFEVSKLATYYGARSLMEYFNSSLNNEERRKLLVGSIENCKIEGVQFYANKLNISLVDKKYDGKSILGKLFSLNGKNCRKKVENILL
ncbi:hypothetical protein [Halobacteriovorax sp. JY17]|uniref:hypothetical protein n=1 Tax=Halobacteriovorax sp. JY17 TaxID=2014617 RepID=UPI000C59C4A9|nr:hypothetical protein [Halobacteriovorax sp. JY17]PIK15918.1 MAG: hypothetical protein CES88_04105 [Halobacteriovorax sp. JY17]